MGEGGFGVGGRFPDLGDLGPLGPEEWRALRSLNRAYVDLGQEWESARAQSERLSVKVDLIEGYAGTAAPAHHLAAMHEVCGQAIGYEERVGAAAWRYASAAAVLGMAVMDRLLDGRPPLTDDALESLGDHEPTLGLLKRTCGERYGRLIASTESRCGNQSESQRTLLALLSDVEYDLCDADTYNVPLNSLEIDACRLTHIPDNGVEPTWTPLLRPFLNLAESIPYSIAWWVERHTAPAPAPAPAP
jgi:hypothetical protein